MKKMLFGLMLLLAASAATLYYSPSALLASMQLVERQLAGLSPKQLNVGDLSIHYYQGGPPDAPTILMLHGFGANKDNWLRFARHFTDRYQVIAIDLPGFGDSSKPAASYDVGSQVERVAAFVQALGIERLHIIGNSMGGHISALYAARYPEQVLSVALLANAGITAPQKSQLIEILERGEANPLVVSAPQDFDRLMEFVFVEPPYLPAKVKEHMANTGVASSALNRQIFDHLINRYIPLEPELAKIQAPTLVLWGEQDRALHVSSVEVMRPLLRKPTVVVMEDCGHLPMIERPAKTAMHYQAFLDSAD
jgi:abhydrolase domain-containing protein 6